MIVCAAVAVCLDPCLVAKTAYRYEASMTA
jgi:hypothetical protein